LVTISHDDITDIRMVNNNEDITSNSLVYTARQFNVTTPPQTNGVPKVSFDIDNTDLALMSMVQNVPDEANFNLRVIRASIPDTIELEYDLSLKEISGNFQSISGTLSFEDILNFNYPYKTMNPEDFPAIFQ